MLLSCVLLFQSCRRSGGSFSHADPAAQPAAGSTKFGGASLLSVGGMCSVCPNPNVGLSRVGLGGNIQQYHQCHTSLTHPLTRGSRGYGRSISHHLTLSFPLLSTSPSSPCPFVFLLLHLNSLTSSRTSVSFSTPPRSDCIANPTPPPKGTYLLQSTLSPGFGSHVKHFGTAPNDRLLANPSLPSSSLPLVLLTCL
ncbi:hypothetical protein BKA56DRAFT_584031 [Ilyonectria sp. MPI-CAGE-AT-0026]|nr:hypothetical protein BKA56DRAFT_584031 [Ilyonectria sp. MPI-CAGE-AT-0026]